MFLLELSEQIWVYFISNQVPKNTNWSLPTDTTVTSAIPNCKYFIWVAYFRKPFLVIFQTSNLLPFFAFILLKTK